MSPATSRALNSYTASGVLHNSEKVEGLGVSVSHSQAAARAILCHQKSTDGTDSVTRHCFNGLHPAYFMFRGAESSTGEPGVRTQLLNDTMRDVFDTVSENFWF